LSSTGWRIILKCISVGGCRLVSPGSGQRPVVGSFEHGSEPSGFIKYSIFFSTLKTFEELFKGVIYVTCIFLSETFWCQNYFFKF